MIKIFIPIHSFGAGKWIYEGFFKAWKNIDFEPVWYDPKDLKMLPTNSHLMAVDSHIVDPNALKPFNKVFLFCLPGSMPKHWNSHPNFVTQQKLPQIEAINGFKNVSKWSFVNYPQEFAKPWENVQYIPLAFDNLSYSDMHTEFKYDVCFIGGWADNGFNEKAERIKSILGSFKDSGLRCGFFVNKNLTHEQENRILSNTKFPLNIHDKYQVELGWDTNERTFKSLGLSGVVVSDYINVLELEPLNELLIFSALDSRLPGLVDMLNSLGDGKLIRGEVKDTVMRNHTYTSRVKTMLELSEQ